MARYARIPAELTTGPFHRRTALAAGVTDVQLRSRPWKLLIREVYCLETLKVTPEVLLQALLLAVPPHAVITGKTAAWLYGAWEPDPRKPMPLECTLGPEGPRFSRRGVTTHRLELGQADFCEEQGLRVTSPARTCFGLMAAAPSLTEAVVIIDAFRHNNVVTAAEIVEYANRRPRWPHVRKVRAAVTLSDPATESPMESRMRMVLVLGGLPWPHVNRPFYDADGNFVARPDDSYLRPDTGIEYLGAYHFTPEQRVLDDVRENSMLTRGMPTLKYDKNAVYFEPDRIIADVVRLRPDLRPSGPLDLGELYAGRLHISRPEEPPTSAHVA